MVNAGASIEAFLKLDATNFRTGIAESENAVQSFKKSVMEINNALTKDTSKALDAVTKLVTALNDIGMEGNTVATGFNQVRLALQGLVLSMNHFDEVQTSSVNKFKTMASGLMNIATAAQRMSVVLERGGMGIEALNEVMTVFESGLANAETTIKLSADALRVLVSQEELASSSTVQLSESFELAEATLMQLSRGVLPFNRIEAESNKVRETMQLADAEFKRASEDLLLLGRGIPELNRIDTTSNKVKASIQMMDAEFKRASEDLLLIGRGIPELNRIDATSNKVKESIKLMDAEFKRAREDLLAIGRGALEFNRIDATSNKVKYQMELMNAEFEKSKAFLEQMAFTGVEAFNKVETGTQRTRAELERYEAELQRASTKAQLLWNQNTSSVNRTATATRNAATATNAFGNALSSVKSIGTLVASMMVYNFAHNLIKATRETVNAKSEMEGYFQMLHFGQGQIDNFNKALDDTIKKFPRINKYSLGETISSIGVEFELTTKEMEKAMPVVSMITSEYLRAGRNANEASLAVKDILQGEFQRLSRETGVKGDQLKEAGWSGDKSDVMGLLEALDKVGKSRNWDTFVTKANSLNDAVMILQNRFGEWSAEMVNVVQPTILGVFNALMSVGGFVGTSLGRVWEWINGDGIANQVVKWTGLATAIGTVTTALISYRTGANLAQIVQMGLRGSIVATTFGLKAEEVATYGSRNAITAKITSLRAEQVATMGVKNALVTKALGLDAEVVATMGIKNAIGQEVLARRLQEAQIKGATVQQKMHIVTEYEEQMAKRGTLSAIFAKIAGVNMETFAEKGLTVALAERVASSPLYIGALEAEEVAEMSTAEASLFLAGTLTPLIALLAGVAVALYSVIKPLMDASAEMKAFNNVVDNGEAIMNQSYATQKQYRDEVDNLTTKLGEAEEGTKKYKRIQDKLKTASHDYALAQKNVATNIKATTLAKNAKEYYDDKKERLATSNTIALADAYIKAGYSATEASEMASSYYRDAEKGAKQLRSSLQRISFEYGKGQKKTSVMLEYLKAYDVPKERVKELVNNLNDAHDKIAEGFDRFMTSDDLMERVGGWLEIQEGRFEAWWTELNSLFEVRDWEGIRDKLIEGLKYVFTGLGAYDWISGLSESIGEKGIVGTLMEFLWGEGDADGVLDIISDWGNSMIIQPLASWLNWFLEDPYANFGSITDEWSLALAKFLFGKDQTDSMKDIVEKWGQENIIKPINDYIAHLPEHILNYIGETAYNFLGSFAKMLFGDDALQGVDYSEFTSKISEMVWGGINSFIDSFNNGDESTGGGPGIAKKIDGGALIKSIIDFGEGVDIGGWLNSTFNIDGLVSSFVTNISSIVTSATSTASSVGTIFSNLKSTVSGHIQNVVSNVTTGFESVKTNAVSKITAMRDSVGGVINQMTDAWRKMKDSILNSAKLIYDGVKSKFDSVKTTLSDFFTKLQNPSQWGSAGFQSMSRSPKPSTARRIVSSVRSGKGLHGAGVNPYRSPNQKVKLQDLLGMVDGNNMVTLSDFLSMFTDGGFGGWSFHEPSKKRIFNTGKEWKSGSPVIKGIGSVGDGYKVKKFWDGKPSFTFEEFQKVAEAIFSQIPYKFYYDSEWKGSWLGALLSGAVNCSDGADALIALASVFGFSGEKVHTTTKSGVGHFFARINGVNMDTTNFQNSRSWSPLGGAGVPTRTSYSSRGARTTSKEVNVHIHMSNNNIYGVDDLEAKIEEGVSRGMREQFNDSYTVVV